MSDFSLFTFFMHLSWLHSYTARLLQRDRSKIAKTEFTGSYKIRPLFGHFHHPPLPTMAIPSKFPPSLHFQKQPPRSSKKALSFLCLAYIDQDDEHSADVDEDSDDHGDYFAHLDRPADDLSQLDDNDRDGDGDEEEEDQLEEQWVRWSDCHEGIEGPLHWCAKDKEESTKGLDKGGCAINTAINVTIMS